MTIKTAPISLTPKQHFFLSLQLYRRPQKLLLVIAGFILILAGTFLTQDWELLLFILLFFVLYACFLVLFLWRFSHDKKNKRFQKKITYEIDEKFIHYSLEDDSKGSNNWDNAVSLMETPEYYLVFNSKITFYYFPKNAFLSNADRDGFEQILRMKGLLKSKA